MKLTKMLQLGVVCALTTSMPALHAAESADTFPNKPIVIVVPFAAGGSTDQIGRMIAQHLHKKFSVPAIVENRPGAAGTIGNAHVARAKPDGYTLLIGGTDITASQYLYKNLPYDPATSLQPVAIVSEFPFLMVVKKDAKINTVKDFIAYGKANPDKVSYSSAGMGNSTHLAGAAFQKAAGLPSMVHAPFNGSSPALTAVIGGQVDTVFDTAITAYPQVKSGTLKPLAVLSAKRLAFLPDVPTLSELGFSAFDQISPWSWKGLFAPAGTPQPVVEKLHAAMDELIRTPEFSTLMEQNASIPVPPMTLPEAREFIKKQRTGWKQVITAAGIEPQ